MTMGVIFGVAVVLLLVGWLASRPPAAARAVIRAAWEEHGRFLPRFNVETGCPIEWRIDAIWDGTFDPRTGDRATGGRWRAVFTQVAPRSLVDSRVWTYDPETRTAAPSRNQLWR